MKERTIYQHAALRGLKLGFQGMLNAARRWPLRNQKKIFALNILVSGGDTDDWLLERLGARVGDFEQHASVAEFGDGTLLELWLDFFKSPEFEEFVTQLLRILEKVFELIGPLL